jgi:hypothetical protein
MSVMSPLMNMGSQNRMLPEPTPLAQRCVSLALLCATASPAPSFSQGAAGAYWNADRGGNEATTQRERWHWS